MSPMLKKWICLDVASASIENAASFLEGTVKAPANYKDAAKIAEYVAEKEAERLAMAATDLDLARLTCACFLMAGDGEEIEGQPFRDEEQERIGVSYLSGMLEEFLCQGASIVTFGGNRFDLPLLMRRARYLGVEFPRIDLDRYRSVHVDMCERLNDKDSSRRRSLDFYVKRLGFDDLNPKPMTGEDEARIFVHQDWERLRKSVARDVEAIRRVAHWDGVL